MKGCYLQIEFPDDTGVLETAYKDFKCFLKVCEMEGEVYPIYIQKGCTPCFEAYSIEVEKHKCVITATDTEGIRRALVFFEDECLRREGAFLPLGRICRKPHIRTRITRGFFSPTNRPPKCGDELTDKIDYYPEEYLNRLAHDGANGLWIYTRFQDLLQSDIFPEYGVGRERRIEKLKDVIRKCARYGIKIYIFAIEPIALSQEMGDKYPQVLGGKFAGNRAFCTRSDMGERYCIEATRRLMEELPELGGYICITAGERLTSCASASTSGCSRCNRFKRGENLSYTVNLLKEGMRQSKNNADFVSWTYEHRNWNYEDIKEYVRNAPDDVMLMQNFEDRGYTEQLGVTRQAIDYWLSYAGPSELFRITAETAKETGKHMFAKMQVCCSHELASVPYIPVPGILYDKYMAATALGVEGVMQCWYFGNYPSMMSKAAGELAFVEADVDKESFLRILAGIYYGNSRATQVVEAWKHFEEGYRNYPVNIMFSYYGPMHDGPVWELALLPKNRSLPRTWLLPDPPDGDRIGECLQSGHSLEEALILSRRMTAEWAKGLRLLPQCGVQEQENIAKAVAILLTSGRNILEFYQLREELGLEGWRQATYLSKNVDCLALLEKMEVIVREEIANSAALKELCLIDNRLGYHSEAEGYKFFPEKLDHRMKQLQELLKTEFAEVKQRIREGKAPLEYYLGEQEGAYEMHTSERIEECEWQYLSDNVSAFRASYDCDYLYLELKSDRETCYHLTFEYKLLWPSPEIIIDHGVKRLGLPTLSHQSMFGEKNDAELDKYQIVTLDLSTSQYLLKICRNAVGWNEDRPLKLRIAAGDGEWQIDALWKMESDPVRTLGKANQSPGEYGWLMPIKIDKP